MLRDDSEGVDIPYSDRMQPEFQTMLRREPRGRVDDALYDLIFVSIFDVQSREDRGELTVQPCFMEERMIFRVIQHQQLRDLVRRLLFQSLNMCVTRCLSRRKFNVIC